MTTSPFLELHVLPPQVRFEGDLEGAMVQFSSPPEAKRAHDSTEAVLNNRFIRVYYLRKDDCAPLPFQLREFSLEVSVGWVDDREEADTTSHK